MRKLSIFIQVLIVICINNLASAQSSYFYPEGVTFDTNIPSPEQFLGYGIGDFHTRHDRVVSYFQELARVSDKAFFEIIGYTNEMRPQIVLTITDPDNFNNLREIREEHLKFSNPNVASPSATDNPVIVLLGYNVHGNEPSSTEAAMLTAYYLVAAQNEETSIFLKDAVIFIDPVFNPDGRDRHTNWVNMHKSRNLVADSDDREHNEVWPGGRTNHYWFDLNRDWLPLAQVESRNRVAFYRKWMPNVVTDYHEMGTNSTYFFEPTKPFGSENPLVPRSNYDGLNNLFAKYFQQALDDIGSLYFTKEVYDNSYPGYGSTYPDIHGGLGMVFEQASSRGHLQESSTKDVAFAFTIRNHLRTSIATVRASVENSELLLNHQRKFFEDAFSDGKSSTTKSYVFHLPGDQGRLEAFTKLLLKHEIKTYQLQQDIALDGVTYKRGESLVVPSAQAQYKMVQTFFEPVTSFHDSVFYDASAWTVALAFGVQYSKSAREIGLGQEVTSGQIAFPNNHDEKVAKADYAYLFEWSEYLAPKALYHLLENGVYAKAAFSPFSAQTNKGAKPFGYGSVMVSVADQSVSADRLNELINEVAQLAGIEIHTVSSGMSLKGIDLGSRNFRTIERPRIAMVIGDGSSSYEVGEIWHLLDTRYDIPVSKIDVTDFNGLRLEEYNVLILASGFYSFDENTIGKIKSWASAGGTLILQRNAVSWAIRNKLVTETFTPAKEAKSDQTSRYNYETSGVRSGAKRIGGSVYKADIDTTHPIGFGYKTRDIYMYRNHNIFIQPSKSPYSTIVQYKQEPHIDGYVHKESLEMLRGTASVIASRIGGGRAILYIDNPNFRGFWYGTNRLFLNGLFFGRHVSVPR